MADPTTAAPAAVEPGAPEALEPTSGEPVADGPTEGGAATDDVAAPGREDVSAGERLRRRIAGVTWPQGLVAAMVVVYVAWFTGRSLDVHHALGSSTYDVALYDQGVWLLSRFEAPFVTLMGRNLFGDHTSFVLLLLVPLYWIWPSAGVLFLSQSLVIGLGAIPVFLASRRLLGSERLAVVPAAAYLAHPAVGWTNLENFHPDAFLGLFVGGAIWAALERRWVAYAAFVVLALSVKEDVSLVVVPLGIWVALRRDRRIGALTVVGSVAWMAFAMFVVMRGLIGVPTRNTWRIPFGGPGGLVETTLRDPGALLAHLRSDGRPSYLLQMTAPVAWAFLRRPSVAAISALVLFTNVLSTFWYQYQVEYHYGLIAVPALCIGAAWGIGALRDEGHRRSLAVGAVGVAALVTSFLWSPVPWGRTPQFVGDPGTAWATAAREIIDDVPPGAIVSAHYRITPHVAHRREIYQFPVPFRSVLYGPNGNVDGPRLPERAERVEYVVLPTALGDDPIAADWALVRSAFVEVESNDSWALYRRDPDVALTT